MQADAEQAYIQAKLSGTRTWVELPREEWPQDWIDRGLIRPVCPLELALYGHPDSGGHWEAHCEGHLASVGFENSRLAQHILAPRAQAILGRLR